MEKRVQRGGGGENPAVQGMPSGQKKKRGQFKGRDLSPASKILPDEVRKQSEVRTLHSGAPKGSRRVEHANHLAVNLGIWNCLRKLTVWILNKLVAFRLVNEQSTKNFLVHLLVAVKYNLDRSEVVLLQTLASQGKVSGLDPSYFGEEERKAFERAKHLHQILEGGIRKAFGGTTNGIKAWYRLRNMPLREARGIWQRIANEVAVDCSDATGHVDVERLEAWMEFLGDAENFRAEPFRYIPHAELMRSQMHRVCECLVLNRNGAMGQLNAANGITVGEHGQSILATMSNGREPPLKPAAAILASLFAPHRQLSIPACTIHSTINAEIWNHPERLIKMYTQMLSDTQFTFPSGYAVRQQPIVDGFITVDLKNGREGRDRVFRDITGGIAKQIAKWRQIAGWRQEGIEYSKSTDEAEKYKFEMLIHNMNDVLFVHFFQVSNFGNRRIDSNGTYGTMLIYAGHEGHTEMYSSTIQVDGSNFLAGMAELKEQAEAQLGLGHRYMRVSTRSSSSYHAENIDIDALRALDLDHMEPGKAYPIGDRNYGGYGMSWDIRRLAVRKVDGTPTYEFGTLWYGSQFEKKDISEIRIHATNVNVRNARYWAPFRP